jgi:hypothetical protein
VPSSSSSTITAPTQNISQHDQYTHRSYRFHPTPPPPPHPELSQHGPNMEAMGAFHLVWFSLVSKIEAMGAIIPFGLVFSNL